jgi:hypothetical protein
MRRKYFIYVAVILIVAAGGVLGGTYSGGTGEPNNPYLIATPEDLNSIGLNQADWNKCFKLVADINLAQIEPNSFNIIGYYSGIDTQVRFSGTFDGDGYTITNFNYCVDRQKNLGIFGCTGTTSIIKNLNLRNVNIAGRYDVGGLIGYNFGHVEKCTVTGKVSGSSWDIGGLVGYSESGIIKDCNSAAFVTSTMGEVGGLIGYAYGTNLINCHATGNVTDTSTGGGETGGLAGYARNCSIINCSATGNVFSSATLVGGLVGLNQANIANCFATGDVNAVGEAGGLVGRSWDSPITISDCYATGNVHATNAAGGFAGWAVYDQSFKNCYCTGAVIALTKNGSFIGAVSFYSGHANSFVSCFSSKDANPTLSTAGWLGSTNLPGNPEGILALTSQSLKTQSTFTDAGWDFVEVWDIGENQTYPFLRKYAAGDLNHDGIVNCLDLAILAGHWLESN